MSRTGTHLKSIKTTSQECKCRVFCRFSSLDQLPLVSQFPLIVGENDRKTEKNDRLTQSEQKSGKFHHSGWSGGFACERLKSAVQCDLRI